MTDTALAVMDKGEANQRILAKDEHRADFRRVEGASLKRRTRLQSAEGKRLFARCFYSFQASMYFVSTFGRSKLPLPAIEAIEAAIRKKLQSATAELDRAIDGADILLKNHSIENVATFDTVPLEEEVGITSALGRRYFELIHKLDQVMPLLRTLEIEEVISEREVEKQRSRFKRVVLGITSSARNLSIGVRRRMNEADAKRVVSEGLHGSSGSNKAGQDGVHTSSADTDSGGEPAVPDGGVDNPEDVPQPGSERPASEVAPADG